MRTRTLCRAKGPASGPSSNGARIRLAHRQTAQQGSPSAAPPIVHESQEIPGLIIGIARAPGQKCERCWMRSERVGESAEHPTLCDRCVRVVTGRPA